MAFNCHPAWKLPRLAHKTALAEEVYPLITSTNYFVRDAKKITKFLKDRRNQKLHRYIVVSSRLASSFPKKQMNLYLLELHEMGTAHTFTAALLQDDEEPECLYKMGEVLSDVVNGKRVEGLKNRIGGK